MSDTIPETVAAVLAHDAKATPARNWSKPSGYDPDAMCAYYYRTAAPALAREVGRLLGLLDALPASWRNLSDERNTARAECERLRVELASAIGKQTDACHEIGRLRRLLREACGLALNGYDYFTRVNEISRLVDSAEVPQ